MVFSFGDICLIQFPFTDGIQAKKRPAILLSTDPEGDAVFLRVTTKLSTDDGNIIIEDWRECGLLAPSCIKTNKFATLSLRLVDRKLGVLLERDKAILLDAIDAWRQKLR